MVMGRRTGKGPEATRRAGYLLSDNGVEPVVNLFNPITGSVIVTSLEQSLYYMVCILNHTTMSINIFLTSWIQVLFKYKVAAEVLWITTAVSHQLHGTEMIRTLPPFHEMQTNSNQLQPLQHTVHF